MNFNRFKVNLDQNKATNSKNGIIGTKENKKAQLRGSLETVDIILIKENPDQARSFMSDKEFDTLKQSIKREGLLHPIIVYKDSIEKELYLKAGHRRLRALKELGYTEVECAIFNNKTEATFAAISTNEFAESIHPIDKGVEVRSLIKEFKSQNMNVSLKDIADFYGAKYETVKEWAQYGYIDKSVRSMIIKNNIRSKNFLRKATSICKNINNSNLPEEVRLSQINKEISELLDEHDKPVKNIKYEEKIPDGASIRNFLYYDKHRDEYLLRESVVKDLSLKERERLKTKAQELVDML